MKKTILGLFTGLAMLLLSCFAVAGSAITDVAYYDPVAAYDLSFIAFTETAASANTFTDDKKFLNTETVSLRMPKHGMTWARLGVTKVAGIVAPFTAFKAVYKPDSVPIRQPLPV